ncbi:Aldo/keto reductase [Obba rivulosa]|uniref:Aldo/keto reductase n=1 Tax=Obba rivulosa TaxID=1052685 RepID=A0A8E2B4D9_9APHY|nr:Aldo/keto reductase [Obba rivulosa]
MWSRSLKASVAVIALSMAALSFLRRYSQSTLPAPRTAMSSLTLPLNDGRSIPWLGFGTGTALYNKDAEGAVKTAIAAGVVHLDGAQMYANEESLGAAIKAAGRPRDALWVTTKLGKLEPGETVRESLLGSLKKLQLDYVDLFLIHVPTQHTDLKGVWKQFEELKQEGLAKSIGVSNFRVQDFEKILDGATVVPSVNQIEYHPYVFKASQPVVEFMKKHNIRPTSYGGLSPITRKKGGPLDPVLVSVKESVSKRAGQPVNEGQVLQLWLRTKGIPAITTSSKEERIKEYLAVETLPELTSEEEKAIDDAGSQTHHRVFMSWMDE